MAYLSRELANLGYTGVTGTTPYQPSTAQQVATLRYLYTNALSGRSLTTAAPDAVQLNINFDGTQNNRDFPAEGEEMTNVRRIEVEMAFFNERISAEDADKYGIAEINKHFFFGPNAVHDWTIDRTKNVYLRLMKNDREKPTEYEVSFFWKNALFHIDLKVTGGGEKAAEGWKGWTHWAWNGMRRPKNPDDQAILDAHRAEILADLKDALTAFKDAGVYSRRVESTTTFDF